VIVAMVVLVALLASLQPAWKASRMDPVKALGHV
jgi:putative ABC transport system permease protein